MTDAPGIRARAFAQTWLGRLSGWLLAWVGAIVLVQILVALAPGDAIDTLPDPGLRAQLTAEWGLGGPLATRVIAGTWHALIGAWGSSWTVRPGDSVGGLVATAMGASAPMLVAAWAVAVGLGAAVRGRGWGEKVVVGLSTLPVVLLALGAIEGINAAVWAGMSAGWWGRPAFFALPMEGGVVRDALALVALGVGSAGVAAVAARLAEADARIDASGFVLAARARGMTVSALRSLKWRHRVVPLIEGAQAAFPPIVGGLVVVERLCALPGAGDLLWRAVEARDIPVATGVVVALTGTTVVVGAALDLLRRAWDPRLRAEA